MVLLRLFLFFIVYPFAAHQRLFDVEIFTIEDRLYRLLPFSSEPTSTDAQAPWPVHRRHSNGFGRLRHQMFTATGNSDYS